MRTLERFCARLDRVEDRHRLAVSRAHDQVDVLGYEIEYRLRRAAFFGEHRLDVRRFGHTVHSLGPPECLCRKPPVAPTTSTTISSNNLTRNSFPGRHDPANYATAAIE
jgi:hypothetical protein